MAIYYVIMSNAIKSQPAQPAQKVIITEISCREEFHHILELNPGLVILKFGASWCGPCKRIKAAVNSFFATSPQTVVCADLDVDHCSDLYIYLKSKKMINGIPTMLMYRQGNHTFIPDDSMVGADAKQLDAFFKRCGAALSTMYIAPPHNRNARARPEPR